MNGQTGATMSTERRPAGYQKSSVLAEVSEPERCQKFLPHNQNILVWRLSGDEACIVDDCQSN